MKTLVIVNDPPYGTERAYNALRLASSLLKREGEEAKIFLIGVGGTVTWVNCDDPGQPAHTSTADQGAWSSPSLNPGDVFSRAFAQAGTFAYHCEPHPFMTATVIVE